MKRVLVAAALLAIAAGSFQPYYLTVWKQDWNAVRAFATELPYRKIPGLRRLCVEADQRIPTGARVLFVMPPDVSDDGYDYAFGRAQYLMGGKDLVPLFKRERGRIDYIVCWRRCPVPSGFAMVWQAREGSVARRVP